MLYDPENEVRRAASGLVKVLCKVNDSAAGGKESQRGQTLKQGGALAGFNEWFESMNLMKLCMYGSRELGPVGC